MSNFCQIPEPGQKALELNLNPKIYGSFAEIGAGQEVVRHFFRAGGAAGTIAKTISAYDMTVSDIIYGKGERYVSYERLKKMLEREYEQLCERLSGLRGEETTFFTFANTVSAKSFRGGSECHGWMGVRFQHQPGATPSQVIIHVEMLDRENVQQQEAIGDLGVNLIYAAFYHTTGPGGTFVRSLMDRISADRIQIDVIRIEGPAFEKIDNRLLSVDLVKNGYCKAIMFGGDGQVVQIKDELYKKNILILRGSFRPPTLVYKDMFKAGKAAFVKDLEGEEKENIIELAEISMNQLLERGDVKSSDFLARVDLLAALEQPVLISNFENLSELSFFLTEANKSYAIGHVTGVYNFRDLFKSEEGKKNPGSILEKLGKLFGRKTKLLVYPAEDDNNPENLLSSKEVDIDPSFNYLIEYLRENNFLEDVTEYNTEVSHIWSRTVLKMIQEGQKGWEEMVPAPVVKGIQKKKLFSLK